MGTDSGHLLSFLTTHMQKQSTHHSHTTCMCKHKTLRATQQSSTQLQVSMESMTAEP